MYCDPTWLTERYDPVTLSIPSLDSLVSSLRLSSFVVVVFK